MAGGHAIFVVGAPRTGTTLVKEVLNRHPEIHLFDEVHFFERIWDNRKSLGDLSTSESRTRAIEQVRGIVAKFGSDKAVADTLTTAVFRNRLEEEGSSYRNLLAVLLREGAALRGAAHWGDSSPQDVLYLSTILEWFPDAKIVGLVRDPRGVLSSYKNYYRRGEPTYRESYNPLTSSILWKSYMVALLEAGRASWRTALHTVRYENLVTSPETEVRALCRHVGVDYDPKMIEVERMNSSFEAGSGYTKASGIFTTSIDRWRQELTATEIWLGERIFGGVMRELGYEPASGNGAYRPSIVELGRILAFLPRRFLNLILHSGKPFTLAKLRRVLAFLRSG
jgi:hypothetical protein